MTPSPTAGVLDLAEMRRVAEAAAESAPGNWRAWSPQETDMADWCVCNSGNITAELEGPEAIHIATFDPPTVLALIDQLEAANAERDALHGVDVQPFGAETETPWPNGKAPTARALAECIADLAIDDRSGLIQRVRFLLVRDRLTVRLKHEARAQASEARNRKLAAGLRVAREASEARLAQVEEALKRLSVAYVNLLETGRDRIVAAGGSCDPVDVMEENDPALQFARRALSPSNPETQDGTR